MAMHDGTLARRKTGAAGAAFACLWAFLIVAPVAVADSVEQRGTRLFQRVYAVPSTDCPAGLERIGDASRAVCATYDDGLARLKKTLALFDDKPNRTVTRRHESDVGLPPSVHSARVFTLHRTWRKHEALHFRDWLEAEELLVIAYDETAGRLAVLPKDSCLEPAVRARDDLYFDGGPDFIEARAIESPLPGEPPDSPGGLKKGGDAVVQFVVERDGTVIEACVLHSRPGGFGRRALKTIRRWRFIPATFEDRPVDSVVSVVFRWRQRAWEYEREAQTLRP